MNKDKVFQNKISKQFEFDEAVASVFDDMLDRSVPYYKQSLELTNNFVLKYVEKDDKVFDLGCSTASTLISLAQKSDVPLNLIGVDNSDAMLARARRKTNAFNLDIDLICDDIFDIDISDAKVVIANYTLQFIRPLQREKLIAKIYDGLKEGGIFIFSEKIIYDDKILNKHCIDEYYDFKKTQGYSEFEISQKREALENVLIPYSEDENKKMIKEAGFKSCQTIFKWVNFATFIAFK
ncbi:MAG: carboxy-S-adenosyl-L-methionine synthase CmoA [Campylobacterales bacterium]|nr:carboxy-S-adenosyl-L-methionine synthase CmoA [Campylobacterales bacterium]